MPYSNKQMLRDANGDLIPQYWDVAEQEFKPLTGRDGANDVRLTGSNTELSKGVKVEKKLILDAVSVDANDSLLVNLNAERGSFSELWLALSIDRTPWRMNFRGFFGTALAGNVFYPNPTDFSDKTYPQGYPLIMLYHRFREYHSSIAPQSILESKEITMPYEAGENLLGRIYNDSDEIATVNLSIIKVWR